MHYNCLILSNGSIINIKRTLESAKLFLLLPKYILLEQWNLNVELFCVTFEIIVRVDRRRHLPLRHFELPVRQNESPSPRPLVPRGAPEQFSAPKGQHLGPVCPPGLQWQAFPAPKTHFTATNPQQEQFRTARSSSSQSWTAERLCGVRVPSSFPTRGGRAQSGEEREMVNENFEWYGFISSKSTRT